MGERAMSPMEMAIRVYFIGKDAERLRRIRILEDGICCHVRARALQERSRELMKRLENEIRSVEEDEVC